MRDIGCLKFTMFLCFVCVNSRGDTWSQCRGRIYGGIQNPSAVTIERAGQVSANSQRCPNHEELCAKEWKGTPWNAKNAPLVPLNIKKGALCISKNIYRSHQEISLLLIVLFRHILPSLVHVETAHTDCMSLHATVTHVICCKQPVVKQLIFRDVISLNGHSQQNGFTQLHECNLIKSGAHKSFVWSTVSGPVKAMTHLFQRATKLSKVRN